MKQRRRFAFIALGCVTLFPAGAAAQQLTITSPSTGPVVTPGQIITVTVSVSLGSVLGVLVSAQDIGATALQATAPYSFNLTIPQGIVGLKNLTAIGVTGPEQSVSSAPVQIDVEPSAQATSLSPSLQQIGFGFAGDQFPLTVTATFADGSQLDVTRSTLITFSSVDATVATVDSTGLVTATGAGTTPISIQYAGLSVGVQVTVPPKVVGDFNGDGKVTADDMRILQAFAGTNAVGAFDARDLNGDGKIDVADVQILKTVCGSGCASIVSISATILNSSVNPSLSGQSVALTATVSSAGTTTPTGSIVFLDGGAQIGTLNLDSTGNAVFQTATLAAGAHMITAKYGGDANSTGSTSASLTQLVNGTTTTTALGSSPNPSAAGQSVTFTATVTGAGGTPSGSVTFFDGTTSLGKSSLTTGHASLVTSTLVIGNHSITAQYGGDSTFPGSASSPALTQVVSFSAGQISITTSGLLYSRVSQTFSGTVTITNVGGSTLNGPVQMVLIGLPSGVTLTNATGTVNGSPYITLPSGTSLTAGRSATVGVRFSDPSMAKITFTPMIF